MLRSLDGKTPRVAPSAFVSETAYIVGDVEIGEHSSIWPGVVIRADDGKVTIGSYVNIQDGSIIHGGDLTIEDHVSIGHSVVVHGRHIGRGSLLGNNCTVLDDAWVGQQCLIAANAVILAEARIADRSFVVGVPGQIKRPVSSEQLREMEETAVALVEAAKRFRAAGL